MGILEALPMNFSRALEHLKLGKKVARTGWNGKGMWIALDNGGLQRACATREDELNQLQVISRPFIYMCPVDGDTVPWVASQTDLLADDWILVH